jgi:hypothetical protein
MTSQYMTVRKGTHSKNMSQQTHIKFSLSLAKIVSEVIYIKRFISVRRNFLISWANESLRL